MRVGKAIPREEQCVSRSPSAENIQATDKRGHHERCLLLGAWLKKKAVQWGRGWRKGTRKGLIKVEDSGNIARCHDSSGEEVHE